MNVTTISMTKDDALKAFREYQAAVRADRPNVRKVWQQEDIGLMQAYKQLAKGHAVIDLPAAMKAAGGKVFSAGDIQLPVLALAPSDAAKCFVTVEHSGALSFGANEPPRRIRSLRRRVAFEADTLPSQQHPAWWQQCERSTLVPLIPPHLRPKFDLRNYWTLWEVEAWTAEPPKDPILLKKLGGGLYAVLASWDLTDVERAVLRGRA